jgi:hypothetical protein
VIETKNLFASVNWEYERLNQCKEKCTKEANYCRDCRKALAVVAAK